MKATEHVRSIESSNGRGNNDEALTLPADVFLALTQTKLLIACRLVDSMVKQSGPLVNILSVRLVGEGFKAMAAAIDQAIGRQTDDFWVQIFETYAKAYRVTHEASIRDQSEDATDESFEEGD